MGIRESACEVVQVSSGEATAKAELPFAVQVGTEGLLDGARLTEQPHTLVLASEQLHQRNLRRRLRETGRPQSAHEFVRFVAAGREVLRAADRGPTAALDRIDRLQRISEAITADEFTATDALTRAFGSQPESRVEALEAARAEVETVTGFHPERVEPLHTVADRESAVVAAETEDLLSVVLALQRHLATDTDEFVSEAAVTRAATRTLREDPDSWTTAYPSIERVWVAGASTLSASMADFLSVLGREVDVEVRLCLRTGTAATIEDRLPHLLGVAEPGTEVSP